MIYLKNKLNVQNITDNQKEMNESYIYIKNVDTEKLSNKTNNELKLYVKSEKGSILNYKNNNLSQNSFYKNTYLLNNNIRRENEYLYKKINTKAQIVNKNSGNLIMLNTKPHICQNKNVKCLNKNLQLKNFFYNNRSIMKDSKVSTQNNFAKNNINALIKHSNSMKLNRDIHEKKNYTMRKFSELYCENNKKEFGQEYFIHNNKVIYKLKNNDNTLSNEYKNTSVKFPKFLSLNTKQTIKNCSKAIKSNNCEKKDFFDKVHYKTQNQDIIDLKNKNNFYLNNMISFVESNEYKTSNKNTEIRCNILQSNIRENSSLNNILQENSYAKQNINANDAISNNKNTYKNNISCNNENLTQLKSINFYDKMLEYNFMNFNENNNVTNNFHYLNKNKKDMQDKKIVGTFNRKLFPLNKSFQGTNSKNICNNVSSKIDVKFCNNLNSINEKEKNIILMPTSKNVNYFDETERHDKRNDSVSICSETHNKNAYLENNEKNIKCCGKKIYENEGEKFEEKIKENDENEIKEMYENETKENDKSKRNLCDIEKMIIYPRTLENSIKIDDYKLELDKCKLESDTKNIQIAYSSKININKDDYMCRTNNCSFYNSHEKNNVQIKNDNINMDNMNLNISSMNNSIEWTNDKKKKKKKITSKVKFIFENDLHENHMVELLKILKKVKNSKFNMDQLPLEENGYEKIINYIINNDKGNMSYTKSEELKVPNDETKKVNQIITIELKNRTNSNDYKNRMGNSNLNEKMIYEEDEYKNNNNNNNKSIKSVKENIFPIIKNNDTVDLNFKKYSEITFDFQNEVESCLNIIGLSFNELIHLNKIKDIFWYLYIKSRFFQNLNIVDFCEMLKDKIDENMNKNYFMEYVTHENFQDFSKSNFEKFDNKMKILENLFYLLKSYPLDYDENKGCFYILHPQKNKMFKNSKYNIIKNKMNHLKLIKEVTEHFKNSFLLFDKIFIPKDAFFFVKDSEDIGLRDKSNQIIYVHQALVNDLKEDINDKSIFENFYSLYPPFKSDYFRYIQKKRIHNKIRKIKEYILYYYEFNSVTDFFETLLEFNHEYKNYQKSNNSVISFNLTKKLYEKYMKFKKKVNNYSLQDINQNDDKNITQNECQNYKTLNVVKLGKKNDNYCSIDLTGVKRINENNRNENSQFLISGCFTSDIIESNNVSPLSKVKEEKENDLNEEKNSNKNNTYKGIESKTLNKNLYDKDTKGNKIFSVKNDFTKSFSEKTNIIDENSLIYEDFFNMIDTHKKVKEVSFEIFKIFIENLGKIKGFPNFTSIDECFLGICLCDPDIPKHIFSQEKMLPKKMNFNGFMNCMRYVPYITPDFPIPTCYFSSSYNHADIFNSRNDYINILKYKGKNNIKIELRNKIVLDIIKIFVLISWSFGAETGVFNKFAGIPHDRKVDMVDSSYYINYKYYLKKDKKINSNNNENLVSSNSVSDYFSSSEGSMENEKDNDIVIRRKSEINKNKTSKVKNEKINDESLDAYKDEIPSKNSKNNYQYNNYNNKRDNNEIKQYDSLEQFFLKKKKKMSYKFIPKWHMCNDIFLSRLVSYDEIQISLHKIFPLFMIQTALIYMIHISCCLLNDEEWKYFFQSPFALYNKLTPEEIALRYIKLKGCKFYKLNNININKNIDIHHVFMNIPENMQCHEIYKLAINGENTSTGYLAEPFDIYHLMFVSKVFWYIFRYSDNFLILRSTLLKKKKE
ncbi:conserved Plasmodium protein, unknown function [Plasmodium relictum]|uniref:Uncharacterized protein n=1 Tax=Plasmodium relictum TaxID=85471 RepID=A0A1J1H4B6_PLARL|nr:conserved Plasmodium protein, unknown function [Plasmodium relictum]CRG99586.1 conserved Plasmodium protein, unknown function [Plasmodium relictum]